MNNTAPTTDLDRVVGFTIPERHARGRITRLGPVLNEILSAHAYPPVDREAARRGADPDRIARRDAQECRAGR